MADYNEIRNLFTNEKDLPAYIQKEWFRYNPTAKNMVASNNGMTPTNKFDFSTDSDKFINYHKAYLMVDLKIEAEAPNNAPAVNTWSVKNSASIIDNVAITLNKQSLEKIRYNYIIMDILNAIENSPDYANIAQKNGCVINELAGNNTTVAIENNPGDAARKKIYSNNLTLAGYNAGPPVVRNSVLVSVRVPFTDLSMFFRSLTFPLTGNEIVMDVVFRPNNFVYTNNNVPADGQPVNGFIVTIQDYYVMLPEIKLPTSYKNMALKNLIKSHTWHEIVVEDSIDPIPANTTVNKVINSNVLNVKKLIVFCSDAEENTWGGIRTRGTTSNTVLENCQLYINNVRFFKNDISSAYQFYDELCSLFNMGGCDKNTGTLLSYNNFLYVNRWYGFDLKRQPIFETDSKVNQQLKFVARFRTAAQRVLYFMFQEKTGKINMNNSTFYLRVVFSLGCDVKGIF